MQKILTQWWRRYFANTEALCLVLLLLFAVVIIKTLGNIIAPILIGLIIAYMLTAVVKQLERWHLPHLLAVSVAFFLFIGILLLAFFWLLPLLWEELNNLYHAIPDMIKRGQELLSTLEAHYPTFISLSKLQQIVGSWDNHLGVVGKFILSFSLASISHVATWLIYLVLVPFLVFFFLKDGRTISHWSSGFLPHERKSLQKIGKEINCKIGSYIRGKIWEIVIVFFASSFAFAFMGLPYAVLLGALVGLSVLVPYIGVVVVTVPVIVVALLSWGWSSQFLYLMLVYAVIITLDANVLVPMLFAEAMELHPVAIILAIFIFGSLGGFWGVFFAIPLATLCNVLLKLWPTTQT